MTKKFWTSRQFKSLQAIWDKKLADSGFKDAESREWGNGGRGRLKQNAANSYRTKIQPLIDAKLRYYELLGHHLHEEEYKDEIERLVMERRAEGISVRLICKELKEMDARIQNHYSVEQIIWHYEKKWKIKKKA